MDPTLAANLDLYDVVWPSPSRDASGSMPAGNGDIGINAWVEPDGDVLLLIGKTDAWDENGINLKLGRIRLSLRPGLLDAGARIEQRLHVRTAEISITSDSPRGRIELRIWVDANYPVIRIESAGIPHAIEARLELWRTTQRTIKTQTGDLFRNLDGPDPHPTIVSPDDVLEMPGAVAWCHHNRTRENDGYEINLRLQGLGAAIDTMAHPLRGRTFGGIMRGCGLERVEPQRLRSRETATAHRLVICVLGRHPATIADWQAAAEAQANDIDRLNWTEARRAHERWWMQFWSRSWIFITATDGSEDASRITRAYLLQRFMNASAGRGASPIKYNGSIFTVGRGDDPDFRRWGGPGYWFMNQRLIYWPMLAAGDFDLMQPWLDMYRRMLPLQRFRTHVHYGHGGAHYPETITFWGAEVSAHYGWTPFEQRTAPEAECPYVRYYWSGGLELSVIACWYFLHTQDEEFAREQLLPIADAVTEFYDLHYPRDDGGRIHVHPAQALETWHEATNPLPEIAGLQCLLPMLLDLPNHLVSEAQRSRWRRMLGELPPLPVGEKEGRRVLLPAEQFGRNRNTENPELYAIFPYRRFGLGRPALQLALDTFAARLNPASACWSQDEIQMALLGMSETCRASLARRADPSAHSDSRFPAFWNAHHDWIPDMDHGGVLQMALQLMLLQCDGRRIHLLPAWPAGWDASFRLHAPFGTIVEGCITDGALTQLQVSPASRKPDVIMGRGEAARVAME